MFVFFGDTHTKKGSLFFLEGGGDTTQKKKKKKKKKKKNAPGTHTQKGCKKRETSTPGGLPALQNCEVPWPAAAGAHTHTCTLIQTLPHTHVPSPSSEPAGCLKKNNAMPASTAPRLAGLPRQLTPSLQAAGCRLRHGLPPASCPPPPPVCVCLPFFFFFGK